MLRLLRTCCPRLHRSCAQQTALLQHGVLLLHKKPARLISTKASSKHGVAIAPETDIDTALAAAADAAGLTLSNAEQLVSASTHCAKLFATTGARQWCGLPKPLRRCPYACCAQCEHLQSNWYNTAGDVAQMSKVRLSSDTSKSAVL
jgi:uncharacterized Zn-finger protein